tara:strand:+ start:86 stop:271 length:186 start_codon:yes stop_codon:yes gene_type:complete
LIEIDLIIGGVVITWGSAGKILRLSNCRAENNRSFNFSLIWLINKISNFSDKNLSDSVSTT